MDRQLEKPYFSDTNRIITSMEYYVTLTEALTALKKQGYTVDFNLRENCIVCSENRYQIEPEDFVIDKSFRFDEDENPSDQAVVYAISSDKHGVKGVLVNGYGLYSDTLTNSMLEKLSFSDHRSS